LLEDVRYVYNYDDDGNLSEKIDKQTGDRHQYLFSSENELLEYRFIPSGQTQPSKVVQFLYDGLGRRIEKRVSEGGTMRIVKYFYDRENLLSVHDSSLPFPLIYIHSEGIDDPVILRYGEKSYYFVKDHLGSVRKVIDSSGSVFNSYDYDSFGRPIDFTETIPSHFHFTGREFDQESGLYYYRARYYDSNTGRFLSEDPIFSGGLNIYLYGNNNPLNFIDPLGLDCKRIGPWMVIPEFHAPTPLPKPNYVIRQINWLRKGWYRVGLWACKCVWEAQSIKRTEVFTKILKEMALFECEKCDKEKVEYTYKTRQTETMVERVVYEPLLSAMTKETQGVIYSARGQITRFGSDCLCPMPR
jgi:RHS repeat-associated protein